MKATTQEKTMKAIIYEEYGAPDVLETRDTEMPAVADGDVLVRVRAASINPADWHRLTGTPYFLRLFEGLRRPRRNTPGSDLAGTVKAVGRGVEELEPGDEVFGWSAGGACAEYACVPSAQLVSKPPGTTFEQAASLGVAAFTALQALRDHGRIQPGEKVLIKGASGGVGTFAVQLAKVFEAEVTAVCSTRNVELVGSIGADHVIDYTKHDFVDRSPGEGGPPYHLMLDIAGDTPLLECRRALHPGGTYLLIGGPKGRWLGPVPRLIRTVLLSIVGSRRMLTFVAKETREDLLLLGEMREAGRISPVIDRTYELSETPDALRYLGEGHAQGKIIITPGADR